MIDLLGLFSSSLCLGAALVLCYLFGMQKEGAWRHLRHYFVLVTVGIFCAWTADTLYVLDMISLYSLHVARKFTYWPIKAIALWGLFLGLFSRPAVEMVPVEAAMVTIDAKGTVLGWNHATTHLLGWTAQEAVGQELAALIVPEPLRESHRRGMAHLQATGESEILDKPFKTTALRKDGKVVRVEVTITQHSSDAGITYMGIIRPCLLL